MPRLSSPGTLRSRLAAGAVALAILAVTLLGAVAQVATPVGTPAAVQAIGQLPPPWLEFGPEGQLQARIIVEGACPVLTLDGIDVVMDARGDPSPAFPVVACEATVPFGANVASISGQSLPLPKGPVERIAVIGDAGCRLNSWEKKYQDCNNPSAWPFAQVAASVASWQPDLIVHVGDFLYRESPCPAGMTGCAGSPYGDNWWAWQADFFTPASAMFPVAPFVIMRGNHETCDRNGDGWFAYLDPRPYPGACERFTDPYVTTVHGVTMAVIDSAEASDEKSSPEDDAEYARQFGELAVMAPPGSWLVTHRPVWGILAGNQGEFQVENAAYEAATGGALKGDYALILSGHIHAAESLSFDTTSERPPQIISGNSGTALDPVPSASPTASELEDPDIEEAETLSAFGFLTMETADGAWFAIQRDASGAPILDCVVDPPTIRCGSAASSG